VNKYKKNLVFFFLVSIILFILSSFLVYFVDPLQHYRQSKFYKPYSFEQRYMIWGMLKNYKYDSVLIGTSMTENFTKSNIDNLLNINILKVPIMGSIPHIQSKVFEAAFKNKDLKNVFYGLDLFLFRKNKNPQNLELPEYLINKSPFDDYKYLLNFKHLFENNIKLLLANKFKFKREMVNYDKFYSWQYKFEFSKKLCIEDYKNRINKLSYKKKIMTYCQ